MVSELPIEIIPKEDLQHFTDADYAKHEGSLVFRRSRRMREEAWARALSDHDSSQPLNYLEIGAQEGSASLWFLENKLGHPDSKMTATDIFGHGSDRTLRHNMKQSGYADKVDIIKGRSGEVLRTLPLYSYDAIYVDGLHTSIAVIEDAVLSWRLLKQGGILMFDDYPFDQVPWKYDRPKPAVDIFLVFLEGKYELLDMGWIVSLKKTQDPAEPEFYRSIG